MSAKGNSGTVLVTGGAGYVGSHVCKALADAGYIPVTYDDLSTGHRAAVLWGPFEEGDIEDTERLDRVVRRIGPVGVMHIAGSAYVGESISNPTKYYRNNVTGTLSLLEVMRDNGIGNIVFSSSCVIYGSPEKTPIRDDHPRRPISPYGRTKLAIEFMLDDFRDAHGGRPVSLRYFNAAGADPEAGIGESHDPETHLIPRAIQTALGQRPVLEIFGTDYETLDGTAIRDYVHVSDIADAHLLALTHLLDGKESDVFNLGSGSGYSVRQVIAAVERASNRNVPIQEAARRPGDPSKLVADARRAQKVLGWRPRFGDLNEVVETAWHWHSRCAHY